VQIGTLGTEDVPLPANLLMNREINFIGSMRYGDVFNEAIRLIAANRIDLRPLITGVLPLADASQALRLAADKNQALKVQIEMRKSEIMNISMIDVAHRHLPDGITAFGIWIGYPPPFQFGTVFAGRSFAELVHRGARDLTFKHLDDPSRRSRRRWRKGRHGHRYTSNGGVFHPGFVALILRRSTSTRGKTLPEL